MTAREAVSRVEVGAHQAVQQPHGAGVADQRDDHAGDDQVAAEGQPDVPQQHREQREEGRAAVAVGVAAGGDLDVPDAVPVGPGVEEAAEPARENLGAGREPPADGRSLDADEGGRRESGGEDDEAAADGPGDGAAKRPGRRAVVAAAPRRRRRRTALRRRPWLTSPARRPPAAAAAAAGPASSLRAVRLPGPPPEYAVARQPRQHGGAQVAGELAPGVRVGCPGVQPQAHTLRCPSSSTVTRFCRPSGGAASSSPGGEDRARAPPRGRCPAARVKSTATMLCGSPACSC